MVSWSTLSGPRLAFAGHLARVQMGRAQTLPPNADRCWLLMRLQGGAVGGVSSSINGSGPGSAPAQAPEDIALSMEDFQQIRWAVQYCS